MEDSVKILTDDIKQHLEDHDGELTFWGEKIAAQLAPDVLKSEPKLQVNDSVHSVAASLGSKADQLEHLRTNVIGDCRLCPLSETRIKLVFGVGNAEADVMFVGEGPGFDEDRQGEPFVGKAGQLLDKIMAAIELDRRKVYIANVVKCHPMVDPTQPDKRGNDRPPANDEIEKCRPFLLEQIRVIRPKVIVTLGGTATKAVLQTTRGITSVRGQFFDVKLIDDLPPFRVLPTFHPAALLRDETLKRPVWDDMKKLRELLNSTDF